jgi:hypothetical protein
LLIDRKRTHFFVYNLEIICSCYVWKQISVNGRLTYIFEDRYLSINFLLCPPQHPMTEVTYCFLLMHDWFKFELFRLWKTNIKTSTKIPYKCKVYEQNKTIGKRLSKYLLRNAKWNAFTKLSLPHTRETCWAKRLEWQLAQLFIFTTHVGKTSQQQHNWQNRLHFLPLCSKSHEESMVSHLRIDSNSSVQSSQHPPDLETFSSRCEKYQTRYILSSRLYTIRTREKPADLAATRGG